METESLENRYVPRLTNCIERKHRNFTAPSEINQVRDKCTCNTLTAIRSIDRQCSKVEPFRLDCVRQRPDEPAVCFNNESKQSGIESCRNVFLWAVNVSKFGEGLPSKLLGRSIIAVVCGSNEQLHAS